MLFLWFNFISYLLLSIVTLITLLIAIAYFTLAERKIIASVQRRKGPEIVGFYGLLQPLADGLKLVIKEMIIPTFSNKLLFILSPFVTLILSFSGWIIIPHSLDSYIIDLNLSLLYVLVVSGLGVYGILLAGWASNSKYALLGGLRSVAQMISYEVSIGLIIIPILILSGSSNLIDIVFIQSKSVWYCFPLLPLCFIFFISILAETNRVPFDLPEAEAELVAGYNVEYSGITFASFFLGEYANILLMSSLFVIFFLGGSINLIFNFFLFKWNVLDIIGQNFSFIIKILFINFCFIFIRANLPRFRFDQLMTIGWKVFLPLTLSFIFFFPSILFSFNSLDLLQLPRIGSGYDFVRVFCTRV